MRSYFNVTIFSIISLNAINIAIANDLKLTQEAQSGIETVVAQERAWDRSCNTLPVAVSIIHRPNNGTISVVQRNRPISSEPSQMSANPCAGKTVLSNEIIYKSNPDYHGVDSLSYDLVNNNKYGGSRVVVINVK